MADGFEENVAFFELITWTGMIELTWRLAASLLCCGCAGGRRRILDECLDAGWPSTSLAWTDSYGVLFNPDRWRLSCGSVRNLPKQPFVVTDSQTDICGIASECLVG